MSNDDAIQQNENDEETQLPSSAKPSKTHFKLTLCLKEAHDLIAMDKCGTSDPYVKVKLDSQTAYRTKTVMKELDPVWNETCELTLDHLGQKVALSVYDYDRGSLADDFLGRADIDLLKLELDKTVQHKLELTDKAAAVHSGKNGYRGFILFSTHLKSLTPVEAKIKAPDFVKRLAFNNQEWRHMLEVVVAHVRNVRVPIFTATQPSGSRASTSSSSTSSQFYVRLGYGSDWQKTKSVAYPNHVEAGRMVVAIGELFSFTLKDEQLADLNVEMWQQGEVAGKVNVDLRGLSIEQTHKIEKRLSDNCGYVVMTVTITGTRPDILASSGSLPVPTWNPYGQPLISSKFLQEEESNWLQELSDTFSIAKTKQLPGTAAGVFVLKVHQAKNLMVADVGGKSDPFATIEIINVRLRTHTEYKTLHPKWNRTFIIPIDDIHSTMTITVFDDDRNGKPEFLGKMVMPLLRFLNTGGERHWVTLRTSRLAESAVPRGAIEIEGHLMYNKPRAILRALDPKEESYLAKEEKISIKMLQKDIAKVNKLVAKYYRFMDALRDLTAWTNPTTTLTAIGIWVFVCYIFEAWMFPFFLALLFCLTFFTASPEPKMREEDGGTGDDDKEKPEQPADESKFSLTDKLNKLQAICLTVHRTIDMVTSLYERLKNIVLWRSPWVSAAAMIAFLLLATLLYVIPLRWLMMAIGVYELVKKKIRPSAGFEAYDLISRAYTDGEMIRFREPRSK